MSATGPCPDENRLALLVDGALGSDELDRLEAHFDSCTACTNVVRELGHIGAPEGVRAGVPAPDSSSRYRIVAELGTGGMGVVYLAEDAELGRQVALKLLRPQRVGDPTSATERLRREARALASLAHPNVVAVYDVGELAGRAFVALEYVAGETVATAQRRATLAWQDILDLYVQAARGIAAAHRVGIVHRDVKPQNLLVGSDGRVRVTDFGLAGADGPAGVPVGPAFGSTLTETGAVVGTPAYMAPEQRAGEPATALSDQFSLCVSLVEGLTGIRPPADLEPGELRALARHGDTLPAALIEALARGLRGDPTGRFASIDLLLEAFPPPPPPPHGRSSIARRVGLGALAICIAGGLVVAGGAIARRDVEPAAVTGAPDRGPPDAATPRESAPLPSREGVETPVARSKPAAPADPGSLAPRSRARAGSGTPVVTTSTAASAFVPLSDPAVRELLRLAQDQAQHQPADCLETAARAEALAPRSPEVAYVRASCELAAGHCTVGLAAMREALERQRMPASIIDSQIRGQAEWHCPVGEGTPTERLARVAVAIADAADRGDHVRCGKLQSELARVVRALGGSGPEAATVDRVRHEIVRCLVVDHRCGEARTLWRTTFGTADPSGQSFGATHPICE